MLFKLSWQNLKKSFKDYAIYFFTLILGVAIFYLFNSIESQTVLLNVSKNTQAIIQLLMNMLSIVSVFVALVFGFLILYASRFLMKRRSREFGIYMVLGMEKKNISKLLLCETFFIGLLSLFVGLGIGIFLSQIMSVFVANLFEADLTHFQFVFSALAFWKTIIYFGIMYGCVMIFHTISVGKCKLIDLLQASKKSEQVKLKSPLLCIFLFFLAVGALSFAYYKVTIGVTTLTNASDIFLPIFLGLGATFFIIWSLSGVFLRIMMHFRAHYFHQLNSFIVREVSSKINTTTFSLSVITILLFLTICILSSAWSIQNSMTYNLKKMAPMDLQVVKKMNLEQKNNNQGISYDFLLNDADRMDMKLSILDSFQQASFDYENWLDDILEISLYRVPNMTFQKTLGDAYSIVKEQNPYLSYDMVEDFMKISDYNRLASKFSLPTYSLLDSEYILLANFSSMESLRNVALNLKTPLLFEGVTLTPKYQTCQEGFIYMSQGHINSGLFLVPDSLLTDDLREENILVANYKGNDEQKENIEKMIVSFQQHPYFQQLSYSQLSWITRASLYESSVGLSAMVTFIGLYLGIIFLMSSAAILALKELSESADNKIRYQMLRKLGTDEKMICRALFYQIAIFFFFPLLFALIHSIFGIQFCNYLLETFGNEQLFKSIIMTSSVLVFIYGGYFLLTYYCSKNIITDRGRGY